MKHFLRGMRYVLTGIGDFYKRPYLWRFAVLPMTLVLGLYLAVFLLAVQWSNVFAEQLLLLFGNLPGWLMWLNSAVKPVIISCGVLLTIIFTLSTLCPFYEILGGVFFDVLVERFEKKEYGYDSPRRRMISEISFLWESFVFNSGTLGLFLFLFCVSFFFPVAGQFLLIAVPGYRFGLTYMLNVCSNHGIRIAELKQRAGKNFIVVSGFGVAIYILSLIPFALLFILPGVILGGTRLFNAELQEKTEGISDC